jgi:hypothetical protein
MGNTTSASDITSLKQKVAALELKTKDIATLKTQVADASSGLAKSIDYNALAKKITDVSAYNQQIASALASNPGKLGENLAADIGKNTVVTGSIVTSLTGNTDFAKTVSDKLVDDTARYRLLLRGEKGEPGSFGANADVIKQNLYDKKYTLWCADGDICKVPVGNKGIEAPSIKVNKIQIGNTHLVQKVEDGWVRLLKNPDDDQSYEKGVAAYQLFAKDKIWAAGGSRDILAELDYLKNNVEDLKNNVVRKDRKYAIRNADGRRLQMTDRGDARAVGSDPWGNWEKMNFVEGS